MKYIILSGLIAGVALFAPKLTLAQKKITTTTTTSVVNEGARFAGKWIGKAKFSLVKPKNKDIFRIDTLIIARGKELNTVVVNGATIPVANKRVTIAGRFDRLKDGEEVLAYQIIDMVVEVDPSGKKLVTRGLIDFKGKYGKEPAQGKFECEYKRTN